MPGRLSTCIGFLARSPMSFGRMLVGLMRLYVSSSSTGIPGNSRRGVGGVGRLGGSGRSGAARLGPSRSNCSFPGLVRPHILNCGAPLIPIFFVSLIHWPVKHHPAFRALAVNHLAAAGGAGGWLIGISIKDPS